MQPRDRCPSQWRPVARCVDSPCPPCVYTHHCVCVAAPSSAAAVTAVDHASVDVEGRGGRARFKGEVLLREWFAEGVRSILVCRPLSADAVVGWARGCRSACASTMMKTSFVEHTC